MRVFTQKSAKSNEQFSLKINIGLETTVTTINLGLILDGDQSIVSQGDFEHTLENIRLEPAHLEVNATYE